MNQRTKRELEFSVKLVRVSLRARKDANLTLQRLRDNPPDIIITRNLAHRADEFMAATGRRLFVRQLTTGVYRRLADEGGQATTLGIAVAAALTILAVNLITNMVFLFSDVGDPIMRAQDLTFYSSVAVGVFLIYALIWLRIGAQTISKLRRQIA